MSNSRNRQYNSFNHMIFLIIGFLLVAVGLIWYSILTTIYYLDILEDVGTVNAVFSLGFYSLGLPMIIFGIGLFLYNLEPDMVKIDKGKRYLIVLIVGFLFSMALSMVQIGMRLYMHTSEISSREMGELAVHTNTINHLSSYGLLIMFAMIMILIVNMVKIRKSSPLADRGKIISMRKLGPEVNAKEEMY